jgi:hypothetical protein
MKATIKNLMQDLSFKYVLHTLGVEPATTEMAPESNRDQFYNWLVKIGNVYLHDDDMVLNAVNKIED